MKTARMRPLHCDKGASALCSYRGNATQRRRGRQRGLFYSLASWVRMIACAISLMDLRVFMDIFWMRRNAADSVSP